MKVAKRLFLLLASAMLAVAARAQCVDSDFEVTAEACPGQSLSFDNLSSNATAYEWDFCPGDLQTAPSGSLITTLSTIQTFDAIRIVKESDTQFYGFIVKQASGGLFRLDFGDDLSSVPEVESMGALGLAGAADIEFIRDGATWYALVASGSNLIRLKFTDGLGGEPATVSSTNLGNFSGSLNSVRGLSLVKEGSDFFALATSSALNTLTIVKFEDSMEGTTTVESVGVPGSSQLLAIHAFKDCDNWYALLTSVGNNRLIKANLGDDLMDTDAFQFVTQTGVSIQSFGLDGIVENGNYYAFLATIGNPSTFYQLDFGSSFWSNDPVVNNRGSLSGIAGVIAMDLLVHNSQVTGFLGNRSNFQLHRVAYTNDCKASVSTSDFTEPTGLSFDEPGDYPIELKAFDSDGNFATISKSVHIYDAHVPDFSTDKNCVQGSTVFIDETSATAHDIVSWHWNFAGLSTSDQQFPAFQFPAPAEYDITLETEDARGCVRSVEKTVKIFSDDDITPDFSYPDLFCSNAIIGLTDESTYDEDQIVAWEWNFNDDDGYSEERNPTFIFENPGPNEIELIVTGVSGCQYSVSKQVDALQAPAVTFSLEENYCQHETIRFDAVSDDPVQSFMWDFGDGNSATGGTTQHAYTVTGGQKVVLTAQSMNGCVSGKIEEITIRALPVPDFRADLPPYACSGQPTPFHNLTTGTDGEITDWEWAFGDSGDGTVSTNENPEHTYQEAGEYLVSLTTTSQYGCSGTTESLVIIYESPVIEVERGPACEDIPVTFSGGSSVGIASWYWELGTSYYTIAEPVHTFLTPGTYPLYIEVIAENGCTAIMADEVYVPKPLTADFDVTRNCVGEDAVFVDATTGEDPVTTREWLFNDGEVISGSPVIFPVTDDHDLDVSLRVTGQSGCQYEVTRTIEIAPSPVAAFTASPLTGAYPLQVSFENMSTGATDTRWIFHDGTGNTSDESSPVYTFEGLGTYQVELIAANDEGCEDTFSADITTVAPLPDVDIELINLTTNPDGSAKLIVTIHNKGNTVLRDLPVDINFDGALRLREVLDEPVLPATKFNFILNSFIVNPSSLKYLCVSLDLPNDLAPEGNQLCKQFGSDVLVLPVFPNPAKGSVNIEWLAPVARPARATIADGMGRRMIEASYQGVVGMNRRTIDLAGLESGIYFLVFDDGVTRNTQRIAVVNSP